MTSQRLTLSMYVLLCVLAGIWILSHVYLAVKRYRIQQRCGCRPPVSFPHKVPYLGTDLFNLRMQAIKAGNTFTFNRRQFERYGKTYEAWDWGQRTIHTSHVANMQTALVTDFESFGVQPLRFHVSGIWLGPGIFTTDGHYWRHSRMLLRPLFRKAQVADYGLLDVHLDRLFALLPTDGSTVDLQPLFKYLYLDISTDLLFGCSTDALLPGPTQRDAEIFIRHFEASLSGALKRRHYGQFKFLLGRQREWRDHISYVHNFVEKQIDRHLSQKQEGTKVAPDRFTFLDELSQSTHDRDYLRDQLLNVFFPARDTSAIGISIVFFILARHPEVFARIREEVRSVNEPLTVDVINSMAYLQYTLRESIRLHTSTARTIRESVRDCTLPHGGGVDGQSPIFVPKGTKVDMDFEQMHRDPHIWGPDADEFKPERWKDRLPSWEFIPFIRGYRTCPAQQMIWAQFGYIVVRFAKRFSRIENRDPETNFIEEYKMVKQSRNGVKVGLIAH